MRANRQIIGGLVLWLGLGIILCGALTLLRDESFWWWAIFWLGGGLIREIESRWFP